MWLEIVWSTIRFRNYSRLEFNELMGLPKWLAKFEAGDTNKNIIFGIDSSNFGNVFQRSHLESCDFDLCFRLLCFFAIFRCFNFIVIYDLNVFFDFNVQPDDLGFVCLQTVFWGLSLDIWGAGLGGGAWGIGSIYRFIRTKNGTTRMSRFPSLSFTWPFWVNDEMIDWKRANSSIFRVGFLSWCQQIIKFTEKSSIQAWFFFIPTGSTFLNSCQPIFFVWDNGQPIFLQQNQIWELCFVVLQVGAFGIWFRFHPICNNHFLRSSTSRRWSLPRSWAPSPIVWGERGADTPRADGLVTM